MADVLKHDIKSINNKTSKENLESYSKIQLSEAYELYSLYNRYISLFNKISNMTNEELTNEIQNLPWDTLMFAFSSYYEKKPYLSELIQVVQYFIWKTGVTISSDIFPNGSKYLNHSLQESPEDIYINDKEDILIQTILNDENFKNYIDQTIKENSENLKFEVTSGLNFKSEVLFLALNNVSIQISGIKNSSKYEMHIKITDIYDFTDLKELNEYIGDNVFKSFIGSILNNSGIAATSFNVINTYNIELEFDYEVEV